MPTPVTTSFSQWDFSQKELYAATRFSVMNLMLIQTLLAQEAQKKLNLKVDMNGGASKADAIDRFIQQEAALTGGIEMLEYLLLLANETEAPSPDQEGSAVSVSKPATSISQSTPTSSNR